MAVVGDSIAWGNGLAESERFWSRLTGTIEDETGKRVHRQVFAFTRARLGDGAETDEEPRPNETGEVPRYRPSIFEQLDFIDDLELQDLILVSGCINDVSFTNIINPFQNSQELSQLVDKFCLNSMKELLDELRTRAPHARVIVLGYYPIVSEDSFGSQDKINSLLALFNPILDPIALPNETELVSNSKLFDDRSRMQLQQAVADANPSNGDDTMIAFANPEFKPENAMFAPQSWLFGFSPDWECVSLPNINLDLYPSDPLRKCRFDQCIDALPTSLVDLLFLESAFDLGLCIWGSVGHPNSLGENAYYEAVLREWRDFNTSTDGSGTD